MMSEIVKEKVPKLGGIMRLKSGGPPMTVTHYDSADRSVFCCWFWRGRIFRDEFLPEYVEPADLDATGR
jgi:uncharacterized protein YodC (DUF2158 family)